jgi:hypothetical protein
VQDNLGVVFERDYILKNTLQHGFFGIYYKYSSMEKILRKLERSCKIISGLFSKETIF